MFFSSPTLTNKIIFLFLSYYLARQNLCNESIYISEYTFGLDFDTASEIGMLLK